jgi:integrase
LFRVIVCKGSKTEKKLLSKYVKSGVREARKVKAKLQIEIEKLNPEKIEKRKTTFFDFCKMFLEFCRKEDLSPTTVNGYKKRLNMVLPTLGQIMLKDLDTFKLQQCITDLKNKKKERLNDDGTYAKISTTTVNGVYRTIRNVLNRAYDWEYIDANPILRVKTPSVAKTEKSSYNKNQMLEVIKKLYKVNKKRGVMYILTICTGLRRGELLGLHLDDLYLDNDNKYKCAGIFAHRSVTYDDERKEIIEGKPKTEKSKRFIPIPHFCVELLNEMLDYRKKEVKLIKEKYGKDMQIVNNLLIGINGGLMHPDSISTGWKRIVKRFDFADVSLHGLRHTYCSLQRNDNFNLSAREVADLLGHSSITMNDHYTHANRNMYNEALSVFDDIEKEL